jgi:hypothetical protein
VLTNVPIDPAILYSQPGLRHMVQIGAVVVPVVTAEDVIDLAESVAAIRASSVLTRMRLKPCAGRPDGSNATVLQCFLEIAGTRCHGLRAAVAAVHPGGEGLRANCSSCSTPRRCSVRLI